MDMMSSNVDETSISAPPPPAVIQSASKPARKRKPKEHKEEKAKSRRKASTSAAGPSNASATSEANTSKQIDNFEPRKDYDELVNRKEFQYVDTIKYMDANDFTHRFVRESGLKNPIVFTGQKEVLGIKIPDFTYRDVLQRIPPDYKIDMFNHATEKQKSMLVKTIVEELEKPPGAKRSGPYNMLSLECSYMDIGKDIDPPKIVRDLDWAQTVFPKEKFAHREYCKVEKYVLMTMAGSYTEFHIDFGGTSVWYHVLKGEKYFFFVEPTDNNMRVFEEWLNAYRAGNQTGFFGDVADKCACVRMLPGQTLILPAGWIHAVYTPADSLVFGGNFLHDYSIEMQRKVRDYEHRTQIKRKFCYPHYEQTLWYFAADIVKKATGREYVRLIHSDEYETVRSRPANERLNWCFNVEVEPPEFYDKITGDPTQLTFDKEDDSPNYAPDYFDHDYLKRMKKVVRKELYKVKAVLQREYDGRKQRRGKVAEGIRRPKHLLDDFERVIDKVLYLDEYVDDDETNPVATHQDSKPSIQENHGPPPLEHHVKLRVETSAHPFNNSEDLSSPASPVESPAAAKPHEMSSPVSPIQSNAYEEPTPPAGGLESPAPAVNSRSATPEVNADLVPPSVSDEAQANYERPFAPEETPNHEEPIQEEEKMQIDTTDDHPADISRPTSANSFTAVVETGAPLHIDTTSTDLVSPIPSTSSSTNGKASSSASKAKKPAKRGRPPRTEIKPAPKLKTKPKPKFGPVNHRHEEIHPLPTYSANALAADDPVNSAVPLGSKAARVQYRKANLEKPIVKKKPIAPPPAQNNNHSAPMPSHLEAAASHSSFGKSSAEFIPSTTVPTYQNDYYQPSHRDPTANSRSAWNSSTHQSRSPSLDHAPTSSHSTPMEVDEPSETHDYYMDQANSIYDQSYGSHGNAVDNGYSGAQPFKRHSPSPPKIDATPELLDDLLATVNNIHDDFD